MSTSGKINLSILEIQNAISVEGVINAEVASKVESELKKIEDFAQTMEEELNDKDEEIEKAEREQDHLSKRITDLQNELEETEEEARLIKQTLPAATQYDENKNKILIDIHHNMTLEQIEEVERFAKGLMPSHILWKEKV